MNYSFILTKNTFNKYFFCRHRIPIAKQGLDYYYYPNPEVVFCSSNYK